MALWGNIHLVVSHRDTIGTLVLRGAYESQQDAQVARDALQQQFPSLIVTLIPNVPLNTRSGALPTALPDKGVIEFRGGLARVFTLDMNQFDAMLDELLARDALDLELGQRLRALLIRILKA